MNQIYLQSEDTFSKVTTHLPWGFTGQSIYMKSLMLRSSRAFLGGGGFLGLWAIPGDI